MADPNMMQAILDKITSVDKKVDRLESKVDDGFKKVNKRLDKLGLQLAELEDDAPTADEFDMLENRVTKLEHQVTNN